MDPYKHKQMMDVCSNLIFISKIKVNDVLEVQSKRLLPKNLSTSLYRTFTNEARLMVPNESRQNALHFFHDVYKEAFKLIEDFNTQSDHRILSLNLLAHITKSKDGLSNHIKTYHEDANHVSQVEALIEYIETETKRLTPTSRQVVYD